mmetsp:Transcript_102074/g.218556  ORF Transcript_102074/g.218556 Transcript_102074/m.218556 type:complete len:239 (-) Transcript_102074:547-1263(-)
MHGGSGNCAACVGNRHQLGQPRPALPCTPLPRREAAYGAAHSRAVRLSLRTKLSAELSDLLPCLVGEVCAELRQLGLKRCPELSFLLRTALLLLPHLCTGHEVVLVASSSLLWVSMPPCPQNEALPAALALCFSGSRLQNAQGMHQDTLVGPVRLPADFLLTELRLDLLHCREDMMEDLWAGLFLGQCRLQALLLDLSFQRQLLQGDDLCAGGLALVAQGGLSLNGLGLPLRIQRLRL